MCILTIKWPSQSTDLTHEINVRQGQVESEFTGQTAAAVAVSEA